MSYLSMDHDKCGDPSSISQPVACSRLQVQHGEIPPVNEGFGRVVNVFLNGSSKCFQIEVNIAHPCPMWKFPKGDPQIIIHLNGSFPKTIQFWEPPWLWKPPWQTILHTETCWDQHLAAPEPGSCPPHSLHPPLFSTPLRLATGCFWTIKCLEDLERRW